MSNNYSSDGRQRRQRESKRDNNLPQVEIIEQPSSNSARFRYECEYRAAGCIFGVNSTSEFKTYPTIKIHDYQGPAVVVISCVTKDDPPKPHPHSVVGKDYCKNGVCSQKFDVIDGYICLNNLGIQCVKKSRVVEALENRKHERVDPFKTGFEHMYDVNKFDLNVIRLCFQVFIPDHHGKFTIPLKPLVTNPIRDKKSCEELIINRLSHDSAPASGGFQVILLCGKITKTDIEIRFFECDNFLLIWEDFGVFNPSNVHRQIAIVFQTPKYYRQDITEPVTVNIQLRKMSDGSTSNVLPFKMLPVNSSQPQGPLKRKRNNRDSDYSTDILTQMQQAAENDAAIVNQCLLLNSVEPRLAKSITPFRRRILQTASSMYANTVEDLPTDEMRSYHNQTYTYNIPLVQQHHPEGQERPQIPCVAHRQNMPQPQNPFQAYELPESRPSQFAFHRQPEPPPPNVTINSYAYRRQICNQEEPTRCWYMRPSEDCLEPYSGLQQVDSHRPMEEEPPRRTLNNPFILQAELENLPFDGINDFDTISETLSEKLSKELSFSDNIENTLKNIEELNKYVSANQKQSYINFFSRSDRN